MRIDQQRRTQGQAAGELRWAARAACRGADAALFFGVENHGVTRLPPAAKRRAIAICCACPVLVACLEYALARPDLVGIWGATTEAERDEARHRAVIRGEKQPVEPGAAQDREWRAS